MSAVVKEKKYEEIAKQMWKQGKKKPKKSRKKILPQQAKQNGTMSFRTRQISKLSSAADRGKSAPERR